MVTSGHIGKYEIVRLLGRGGFGVVYEAWDPDLKRQVAVKVMHSHISQNQVWADNFSIEAQFMAKVDQHPNVARVKEFQRGEDGLFIVMDYYRNGSLHDLIRSEGPLSVERALKCTLEIANGLSAAHKEGIIHRDIKPLNVLLGDDYTCKVSDFGIAASTDRSIYSRIGTEAYMAPEQALGRRTGVPADIYSLGVTLYEMLTGGIPKELSRTEKPPDPTILHPEIPRRVVEILFKTIEFKAEDRYQSADELIAELKNSRSWTKPKPSQPDPGDVSANSDADLRDSAVNSADGIVPPQPVSANDPPRQDSPNRKDGRPPTAARPKKKDIVGNRRQSAAEVALAAGTAAFKSGLSYYKRGEFEQAIKSLSLCLRKIPDHIDAYFLRAECYQASPGVLATNHRRAVRDLDKVIEARPKDADAFHSRGISYEHLRNYVLAEEDYTSASRLSPNKVFAEGLVFMAKLYIQPNAGSGSKWSSVSRKVAALKVTSFRKDLRPWSYERLCDLGESCFTSKSRGPGRMDLARSVFLLASKMSPDRPTAHQGIGLVRATRGGYADSIKSLDVALEKCLLPLDSELRRVILFDRGVVHFLRKDYRKSMHDFARLTRVQKETVTRRSTQITLERCEQDLYARGMKRRVISPYGLLRERTAAKNSARAEERARKKSQKGFWNRLLFG